jgi:hypothetical protein
MCYPPSGVVFLGSNTHQLLTLAMTVLLNSSHFRRPSWPDQLGRISTHSSDARKPLLSGVVSHNARFLDGAVERNDRASVLH